jgi:hypothetical protein
MRNIICILLIFGYSLIHGQDNEKNSVKNTIDTFFNGFHNQDSMVIKNTVSPDIIMQTIGPNKEGVSVVKTSEFNQFLKSIVSIPDTTQFQEKLLSYEIKVDGDMANAWTIYEFWINNALSHCGVNSFQLHKKEGVWKIIYIIDTRRREGCN